jgi:acyl-coenzyme A synthetase/AMP-(fatty) acid ligase
VEDEALRPEIPASELPDGAAHLKMTSATTSASRMVIFSAEQLAADAENIVSTMGLNRSQPNVGAISLAHSYGFSNLVLPLLLHGVPLLLAESALPESVNKACSGPDRVTLAAVPALWKIWLDASSIAPGVRLAISAGAPLPLSTEEEAFRRVGLKIHNFYGSTECGGIAYDASDKPRADAACVGQALKNVRLKTADNGCLVVESGAVGIGYWPEPASSLGNGRFQTSDVAEIRDGSIFLTGRFTDQINVAGRKISPEVIEHSLSLHPAVKGSLVFGVPSHDHKVETIVAVVSLNRPVVATELRQFLVSRLPAWQVPREWRMVNELPVNERGKISRAQWREQYLKVTSPLE